MTSSKRSLNMDEVHIAQFTALLRTLAKSNPQRQIIIAVHEKPLFEYRSLELSRSARWPDADELSAPRLHAGPGGRGMITARAQVQSMKRQRQHGRHRGSPFVPKKSHKWQTGIGTRVTAQLGVIQSRSTAADTPIAPMMDGHLRVSVCKKRTRKFRFSSFFVPTMKPPTALI